MFAVNVISLCNQIGSTYSPHGKHGTKWNIFKLYRQLQCLKSSFDKDYRTSIPASMFFLLGFHWYINYSLIRKPKHSPVYIIIIFLVSNLVISSSGNVFFTTGGNLSRASVELKSRMGRTKCPILVNEDASCPILYVKIRPYGKLNKDPILICVSTITQYVINVLLNF